VALQYSAMVLNSVLSLIMSQVATLNDAPSMSTRNSSFTETARSPSLRNPNYEIAASTDSSGSVSASSDITSKSALPIEWAAASPS